MARSHDLLVREAVANRAGFLGELVGLARREEVSVEHVYLLLGFRREKACYAAANVLEVELDSVRALQPRIESEEPEWVERVKKEWPARQGDVESVAFWAEVPIQAVMAILLNLDERGDSRQTKLD